MANPQIFRHSVANKSAVAFPSEFVAYFLKATHKKQNP